MDGPTFVQAFRNRPLSFGEPLQPGEVRLSIIQESTVTRVAICENMIDRVMAFAELNRGHAVWNKDLVSVILPPHRV